MAALLSCPFAQLVPLTFRFPLLLSSLGGFCFVELAKRRSKWDSDGGSAALISATSGEANLLTARTEWTRT